MPCCAAFEIDAGERKSAIPGTIHSMKLKISIAVVLTLSLVGIITGLAVSANDAQVSIPLTSVPTFSTENIGRQGHFYVGGKWVGEPGKERMRGAM